MSSLLDIIEASFYTTFRTIFISLSGLFLIKLKIMDKIIMKGVAEITANLLIPCLIFSDILKSFKIEEFEVWVPILVFCLICVFIGFIVGYIISKILCLEGELHRLMLICNMFSNSTSIQLVYVDTFSSLFLSYSNNDTEINSIRTKGNLIVLIYTIFVNMLRWSIGFSMMQPDNNYNKLHQSQAEMGSKISNDNISQFERIKNSPDSSINSSVIHSVGQVQASSQEKNIFKEMINIPFISGILAIVLTCIPKLNTLIRDKNGFIHKTLVESLDSIGKCTSTFTIFILGANIFLTLSNNNQNEQGAIDKKTIFGSLFAKFVIMPFIGYIFLYQIAFLNEIITDPIILFYLSTNFFTPVAVNMITISVINKFQTNNLSKIIIYSYFVGIVTMAVWSSFFINCFFAK